MTGTPLHAATWIEQLQLLPHPEGGYYKENYRSSESIRQSALPARFSGDRPVSTAIYFLLNAGNFSALHRIQSDECWHFYAGDPLLVHMIHPDGKAETVVLGNDPAAGQLFQYVVPAGCWFGSEPAPGSAYSLVGCTVAPGFDFADFELATAAQLLAGYPQHEVLIRRMCRS